MLKYFVEFVGTFFFISVILIAANANIKWVAFPIGFALAMVIYWGGSISGGHFNPAVSTVFFMNNKLSSSNYVLYIICQVLGGLGALIYYNEYKSFKG